MRRNIKAVVARLRARKQLYAELGLDRIDCEISDTCTAICDIEDTIAALEQSPNVIAASLLAAVCTNCSRSDFAQGPGYCEAMCCLHCLARIACRPIRTDPRTRRAFSRKSNIAVVGDALCASLMIEAGRAVADRGCDARQYETRRLTPAGFRIPRHRRFF
jgi:hypothetical protein